MPSERRNQKINSGSSRLGKPSPDGAPWARPASSNWSGWLFASIFGVGMLLSQSVAVVAQVPASVPDELRTVAEKSLFTATSSSQEVEDFLARCDQLSEHIRCVEYGRTVEGKPMTAAILAKGNFELGQKDQRFRALVIGNIHSGECDGKEALLEIIRNFALQPNSEWLDKLVLVIAPNYNADGNDKMGKTNRPGQVGPDAGMGVRPNAQQFDLNRDFVKLDSDEGRNLVSLMDKFDPHLFIDCHTTNGSRHRYLLTYDVPHNPSVEENIRRVLREQMMPELTRRLGTQGIDTFYYGNFDRSSTRWETYGFEPRYSTEYAGLRGVLGVLSESYSYASYADRIRGSREFVLANLNYCVERGDELTRLVERTREDFIATAKARPESLFMVLDARMEPFSQKEKILAYRDDQPAEIEVEFWGRYEPVTTVSLPRAYVFGPEHAKLVDKLKQHGIAVERLEKPIAVEAEIETVTSINRAARAFQSHNMVRLETTVARADREVPAGWYLVRTGQSLGRLASHICEARTCDGFVTWNMLDDHLKEGGEYPIWRVIREKKN
ncbi:MAG: M14 family metallopeptidase [Planctomycetota bacterium]